jgi:hypothetical protein
MSEAQDEALTVTDQVVELRERLTEMKATVSRRTRIRRLIIFTSSGMFILSCTVVALYTISPGALSALFPSSLWGGERIPAIASAGIIYSISLFMYALAISDRGRELDVKDLEDEIDLRQIRSDSLEQKAHKLLRIQQSQLSRYLELVLQQSRGIFVVGIGAMLVGVGVVMVTIWQTRTMGPDIDIWQKAIVAVIGAIGAILTNYVAAIYLKMFSDIGTAVQKSINSLSQSTNLNFANVLIANITSEELRNQTLKEIAVAISKPAQP